MKTFFYVIGIIIFILLIDLKTQLNLHEFLNPKLYQKLNTLDISKNEEGLQKAKQSKIVFCGLCRNIESTVEKNIKYLEYIGSHFNEYRIVLFENDSHDETRKLITNLAAQNNNIILLKCCNDGSCECKLKSKNLYDVKLEERIKKMAHYRNKYLNYVKEKYYHFDYTLVIDMDMRGAFEITPIFKNICHNYWDAIAINGLGVLPGTFGIVVFTYDALAFIPCNKNHDKNTIKNIIVSGLQMNQLMFTNKDELIQVSSAFNGTCLYRTKSLLTSEYESKTRCEHIDLHLNMKKHGFSNIYIDPNWKGYFGRQGPQKPKQMLGFLKN